MTYIKQTLTVTITKVTFAKNGQFYFTISYPRATNNPSLTFKPDDVHRNEELSKILKLFIGYENEK